MVIGNSAFRTKELSLVWALFVKWNSEPKPPRALIYRFALAESQRARNNKSGNKVHHVTRSQPIFSDPRPPGRKLVPRKVRIRSGCRSQGQNKVGRDRRL